MQGGPMSARNDSLGDLPAEYAEFLSMHPDYEETRALDELRETEFSITVRWNAGQQFSSRDFQHTC